jgi:dihydroorotase
VAPADVLGLDRGRMGVGTVADLTIFDPDEEWVVDVNQFASKGRNTPFNGWTLKGKVKYTLVSGEIVYQEGGEC